MAEEDNDCDRNLDAAEARLVSLEDSFRGRVPAAIPRSGGSSGSCSFGFTAFGFTAFGFTEGSGGAGAMDGGGGLGAFASEDSASLWALRLARDVRLWLPLYAFFSSTPIGSFFGGMVITQ